MFGCLGIGRKPGKSPTFWKGQILREKPTWQFPTRVKKIMSSPPYHSHTSFLLYLLFWLECMANVSKYVTKWTLRDTVIHQPEKMTPKSFRKKNATIHTLNSTPPYFGGQGWFVFSSLNTWITTEKESVSPGCRTKRFEGVSSWAAGEVKEAFRKGKFIIVCHGNLRAQATTPRHKTGP